MAWDDFNAARLTPTLVGAVPPDWTVRTIGDLASMVRNGFVGQSLPHQIAEPGVLYLQGFNIRPNRLDLSRKNFITQEFALAQASSSLRSGDVLVVQSGHIGTAAVYNARHGAANCHALIIVRPLLDKLHPHFLSQYLNSQLGQRRLRGLHVGSSLTHINTSELAAFHIALPPLAEQQRIADVLETWDEGIEAADRLIEEKLRRLGAVSAQCLAATQAKGGAKKPAGWTVATFGAVFSERKDRNSGLCSSDVVTVGKYAIRKQSEHFNRSVASADLSPYWTISPGDFVYDPMSAYYGALGRFDGQDEGLVSPAYRVIRLKECVESDFVVELLKSEYIRFQLDALSSQGNKEGKRRSLQRDAFDSIVFFMPPIESQRHIAEIIGDFKKDVAAAERHRDALRRQKRGLMQKLLTGEWRMPTHESDDAERRVS